MGDFTPPAFATAPTHDSCGAFARQINSMLQLKVSRLPLQGFSSLLPRGGDLFVWRDSLQDSKLKEHGGTRAKMQWASKKAAVRAHMAITANAEEYPLIRE